MSAARIGKIRMKAGGAEVRVLHHSPRANNDLVKTLMNALALAQSGKLLSYALISTHDEGEFTRTTWAFGADHPGERLRALGSVRRLEHQIYSEWYGE